MKRGDQTFRIEDYAFIASIIVISIASLIACADLLHFMIAVQRNSSILSLFTWICIPLYIIILIITGFILAYVFENEDFAFGFAILGMPLIVVISGGILMAFSPFSVFYEKYGQWGAYGIAVTCGLIIHLCAIYNCAAYSLIGKIVNHTCSLGEKYSLGIFLTFHYSIFLLLILIIRHDIILDGLILCWPGFLSFGLLLLNYIKNYAEGVEHHKRNRIHVHIDRITNDESNNIIFRALWSFQNDIIVCYLHNSGNANSCNNTRLS